MDGAPSLLLIYRLTPPVRVVVELVSYSAVISVCVDVDVNAVCPPVCGRGDDDSDDGRKYRDP